MVSFIKSQQSTIYVIAALVTVVLLNMSFFFHEKSRVGDFEVSLDSLAATTPDGAAVKQGPRTLSTANKAVYRQYFDDRNNGLMVVTRLKGAAWDHKDKETSEIHQLYAKQKLNDFRIFEISPYEGPQVNPEKKNPMDDHSRKVSQKEVKVGSIPIMEYSDFQDAFFKFFNDMMKHITDHKPSVGNINNDDHYKFSKEGNAFSHREGRVPTYGGHLREQYKSEPVRTSDYLQNFLHLSGEEVRSLKNSHENYLRGMRLEVPEDLLRLGKRSGYMTGDGIVYLGGGKYNQLVLTSISVLRSLGSTIPVELIVPRRKDFDIDVCNNILPKLNGQCRVMEDFVPADIMLKIGGFQLKNVALLVSSFQNVLYLDADNIPLKNPDVLFANEPFTSSRMVMWPDLWRRSTSPLYYEIAGISVDTAHHVRNSYFKGDGRGKSSDPLLISYHDLEGTIPEASSETGQMMIDKEKHFSTLLLSMYYNFYGPDYYYALFSQGAAGEGDKETFIAAAHKLGLPYYQVNEFNRELGPTGDSNKREYFGMGQYDPIIDYLQTQMPDRTSKSPNVYANDEKDSSKDNYDFHLYKSHSLMFLHANWPKLCLSEMFERNSYGRGPKKGDARRRLYSDYILKETGKVDMELFIMRHIELWACGTQVKIDDVPDAGSDGRKKICKELGHQIEFLVAN